MGFGGGVLAPPWWLGTDLAHGADAFRFARPVDGEIGRGHVT
jgi:hypothetical protein